MFAPTLKNFARKNEHTEYGKDNFTTQDLFKVSWEIAFAYDFEKDLIYYKILPPKWITLLKDKNRNLIFVSLFFSFDLLVQMK